MFKPRKQSSLKDFLNITKKEDVLYLADEISSEAKEFFDSNLNALLGYLPEDTNIETTVSMTKPALRQILMTAMLTGYVAKTAEYKYSFEQLLKDNESSNEENFIEKYFRRKTEG